MINKTICQNCGRLVYLAPNICEMCGSNLDESPRVIFVPPTKPTLQLDKYRPTHTVWMGKLA